MKRSIHFLFIAVLLTLSTSVFAEIRETRTIQPFSRIQAASLFEVIYTQSAELSCTVAGDEKLVKNTVLEVKDETLHISFSDQDCVKNCNNAKIKIMLTGPDFKGATLSGLSSLKISGDFPKSVVDLSVSGVAQFTGKINATVFSGSFSGVAEVKLEGTADKADVSVCGTVDLKAREFIVDEYLVTVSGVATAKISVTGKLDATTTGLGELVYWGAPKSINKTVSGLSEIQHR
jgi:hypothetical protein